MVCTALEVVDGGLSSQLGLAAWELQSANTFLASKQFQEGRLAPLQFVSRLEESLRLTQQTETALALTEPGSKEAAVAKQAVRTEQQLRAALQSFKL